jgi:hypothetical protein
VPVMINDRRPATLTYKEGREPCLLPDSVRRKTGIEIGDDAVESTYQAKDGREFTVNTVVLPYVRLGPYLLENVPFLALPPEAEDLGGRITDSAFSTYNVKAQPDRLRLHVKASN